MDWLANILRANPIIPIFLTLGLGFWLGRLKYKSFTLGPVAATLIIGVIIGQLDIKFPLFCATSFSCFFSFPLATALDRNFSCLSRGMG